PPQVAWHENDLAQLVGPRAWYLVEETNDRIEAARAPGGTVVGREEGLAVHVPAAVTHTIGGLQVDTQARVVGADGLWAAGVERARRGDRRHRRRPPAAPLRLR